MEQYICGNVFVPLRSGPSHKSEMLSQILFGEKYKIIDESGNWIKIETLFDNYFGWIDMDHLQQTEDREKVNGLVLNKPLLCYKNDNSKLVLEPGCEIYNPDYINKSFTIESSVYKTSNEFDNSFTVTTDTLADTALKFINSPYIWGGRLPSGLDCSGFVQLVYKIHGKAIPRDSKDQAETGIAINFLEETVPGDLVFFNNARGKIAHVGIIFSRGLVIHCSGRVRIDTIDHQGIFKPEINKYSHHLRMIKRIV